MTNFQIVAMCAVLSLLPVIAWGSLFLYKHGEKRELVIKTFVFSAIAVIPLVFYRLIMGVIPQNQINEYLQTIINFQLFESVLPFNLLILFLTIGFVEEYLKHFVAAKVDQDEIDNIDDAIEFSIIAALGFSFAENTFYFIDVYQNLELAIFWKVVIFRSMFSTLAHIIFSSIYGYHYGLALFGKNIAHRRDFTFVKSINRVLSRFLRVSSTKIFINEQRFLGLFLAGIFHAAFNVFLELNQILLVLPILFLGLYYVLYLINKKQNHINFNQLAAPATASSQQENATGYKKRPDKSGLNWFNF